MVSGPRIVRGFGCVEVAVTILSRARVCCFQGQTSTVVGAKDQAQNSIREIHLNILTVYTLRLLQSVCAGVGSVFLIALCSHQRGCYPIPIGASTRGISYSSAGPSRRCTTWPLGAELEIRCAHNPYHPRLGVRVGACATNSAISSKLLPSLRASVGYESACGEKGVHYWGVMGISVDTIGPVFII